jgi:hypothetical protein
VYRGGVWGLGILGFTRDVLQSAALLSKVLVTSLHFALLSKYGVQFVLPKVPQIKPTTHANDSLYTP